MARVIYIVVDDEDTICNEGYLVEYKLDTDVDWTRLTPDPSGSPIAIPNLEDDVLYNVRYKRYCCDGTISDYAEVNITTTVTSPA